MHHLCEHTSLTHLTTSTKYTRSLSIGINILPGFWHIIWACGLSTSAANGRGFTVFCVLSDVKCQILLQKCTLGLLSVYLVPKKVPHQLLHASLWSFWPPISPFGQPSQTEYYTVSSQHIWHPGFLSRQPNGLELTARFGAWSSRRVWTF